MEPYHQSPDGIAVWLGDCRDVLAALEPGSVQCCVTSPPYWNLRLYSGVPASVWGGDPICQHVWSDSVTSPKHGLDGAASTGLQGGTATQQACQRETVMWALCERCGAYRGLLGNEPRLSLFLAHLVEVFAAVRRVLRPDGQLWVNMGDSFAGSGGPGGDFRQGNSKHGADDPARQYHRDDLPAKNLMLAPFAFAQAMQADGWILRQWHPWVKRNCMPSSQQDRSTTATEVWFQFVQQREYYFDLEAVRIEHKPESLARYEYGLRSAYGTPQQYGGKQANNICKAERMGDFVQASGRAWRNTDTWFDSLDGLIAQQRAYLAHLEAVRARGGVLADEAGGWLGLDICPHGLKDEHYAAYPEKLIEPIVRVSSSERGCCPACGAPWRRVVGREKHPTRDVEAQRAVAAASPGRSDGHVPGPSGMVDTTRTVAWSPSCSCGHTETLPCVCLDPFAGSGTTGVVARRLGRRAILIDASEKYAAMMVRRLSREPLRLL